METIIFEIELTDGRIFRVFCANSTQKKKFIQSFDKVKHLYKESRVITSGIHTVSQWEKMIEHL